MRIKMKLTGMRGLEKNLRKFEKTATKRTIARNALKKGAVPFVDTYRRLAPRDKGALIDSIGVGGRLTKSQRKLHIKLDDVEVFAGAGGLSQAVQQEFGNINHAAQPAARPAWDSQKQNMLVRVQINLEDNIFKGLKRQAKRQSRQRAKLRAKR